MKDSFQRERKSFESQDFYESQSYSQQISTNINSNAQDEESKLPSLKYHEHKYAVSDDYDSDSQTNRKSLQQNLLSNKRKTQQQQNQNDQTQSTPSQYDFTSQNQYIGLNSPFISIHRNQFSLDYSDRYHAQMLYNQIDQQNEYQVYQETDDHQPSDNHLEQQVYAEDSQSSQYSFNFSEHEVWPALVNFLYSFFIALLVTYLIGAGILMAIYAILGDNQQLA
ncbi:transmembrane protein, putative (macronuclear) [Tetrahymena thermophila SB210]|uniref:Transmembrane protein, putative n=1 Tax=Tetrahymena thermophila (strain SB210) TaxID=312017 RepID=Q22E42_TETTS|nr:transmembrane protein, putative [Tetrahymena thermophila SB210]EAR83572.1 transmembrane protein, putative [Tetrahymena thermophila SB210]|eukprot:XP_001031235.1 transmembrane protein, putative [Tetrahymena thermophila SB210]